MMWLNVWQADLLVDRGHPRRQQPAQAEDVALRFVEPGVLVEEGNFEKLGAAVRYRHHPAWAKALD